MTAPLLSALRSEIAQNGDPQRAAQQQAYMKSRMPYAGVQATPLRRLNKALFKTHPIDTKGEWLTAAANLWRDATVREERYSAIELLLFSKYRNAWLEPDALDLLREMIETGAWWDYVDNIASNLVGDLLSRYPSEIEPIMRTWARDPDLWIRRTSILCQLKAKAATDTDLLDFAIQGSIQDADFFARKAIGWALRAHSRVDADWVRAYVAAHAEVLSPLSRREALKLIRADQ